jgi:hypothetical protein
MRLLVLALALAASSAAWTGGATAAAPRIVIVSGAPLEHPIAIADWPRILAVVSEVAGARVVPRRQLHGRPHLKLSLFWGPAWNDYLASGKAASDLRPSQADQVGWFYPAWHGRRALIDLPWAGNWPRLVPPRARRLLVRLGVPVQ